MIDTVVGGSGEREANSDNWQLGKFKSSLCFRLAIVLVSSGDKGFIIFLKSSLCREDKGSNQIVTFGNS